MTCIYPPDAESALKDEFFRDTRTGFFVEVGANDPHAMSQTWQLEQRGWTGVLVEPQPDLAELLRKAPCEDEVARPSWRGRMRS